MYGCATSRNDNEMQGRTFPTFPHLNNASWTSATSTLTSRKGLVSRSAEIVPSTCKSISMAPFFDTRECHGSEVSNLEDGIWHNPHSYTSQRVRYFYSWKRRDTYFGSNNGMGNMVCRPRPLSTGRLNVVIGSVIHDLTHLWHISETVDFASEDRIW